MLINNGTTEYNERTTSCDSEKSIWNETPAVITISHTIASLSFILLDYFNDAVEHETNSREKWDVLEMKWRRIEHGE